MAKMNNRKPTKQASTLCSAHTFQAGIVNHGLLFGWMNQFHSNQFVAFVFETFNNFANQASFNAIRFNGNKGTLTTANRSNANDVHEGRQQEKGASGITSVGVVAAPATTLCCTTAAAVAITCILDLEMQNHAKNGQLSSESRNSE